MSCSKVFYRSFSKTYLFSCSIGLQLYSLINPNKRSLHTCRSIYSCLYIEPQTPKTNSPDKNLEVFYVNQFALCEKTLKAYSELEYIRRVPFNLILIINCIYFSLTKTSYPCICEVM